MKSILILLSIVAALQLQAAPPNIMVMLVDDMGVMDTSLPFLTDASGKPEKHPLNNYYRTPNMERLAAKGVRFNQFCAMSVCSPTRISIMTGQNAARHRTTNWINPNTDNAGPQGAPDWNWQGLKKSDVTLPGVLRTQGYRTIHVGKGHFGPRGSEGEFPDNLGFDINVAGASIGAPGSYFGMENYGGKPKMNAKGKKGRTDAAVLGLEKYHGTDTFLTEALTSEAKMHVADAVKEKKPFYLYFAQYAVHAPHQSDPRFAEHYKGSDKPDQAQNFATLIEGMDKSLGEMMDYFDELGVAKDTLIIFLGDNGSDAPLGDQHAVACAAPLRGKKGSHYEGGMRVPFIAAWAQPDAAYEVQQRCPIAVNAIQTQQAAVQDIFPTLLQLTGAKAPADHIVDGFSLVPLFSGNSDPSRPEKFLMHYPHAPHRTDYFTTYREGTWKVIYHYFPTGVSGGSHYQLYDLMADPYEQNDLASTRPEELKRMMQALIDSLHAHKAPFPVTKDTHQPVEPVLP